MPLLAKLIVDLKEKLSGSPPNVPLDIKAIKHLTQFFNGGIDGKILARDLGQSQKAMPTLATLPDRSISVPGT